MNNLLYSINEKWINKTTTRKNKAEYDKIFNDNKLNQEYYGTPLGTKDGQKHYMVNMGTGWLNQKTGIIELFGNIIINGYSVAGQFKDSHRVEEDFIGQNIVLIDIDDGYTLDTVKENEFYNEFCAGWYTSPSHKKEAHRFRLIFILERTITNACDMRALYTALIKIFGSDRACKDAARLFYGHKDAEFECFEDKVIDNEVIDMLIADGVKRISKTLVPVNLNDYSPPDDETKAWVVEKLYETFLGAYGQWSTIGWIMRDNGFTLADFQQATIGGMMNAKDAKDCETVWNARSGGNTATMGTIYHYIGLRPQQEKKLIHNGYADLLNSINGE